MRATCKPVSGAIWISIGLWAGGAIAMQAAGQTASRQLERLGTHSFKITTTSRTAQVDARFHKAWAHADVSPKFTCYCQAGQ